MKFFARYFGAIGLVLTTWPSSSYPLTEPFNSPLPDAPVYGILNEIPTLDPYVLHAAEVLLVEHERLTSEQLRFALFNDSLADQEKRWGKDWSQSLYSQWKLGALNRGNAALVILSSQEAEIVVGYALETLLSAGQVSTIRNQTLLPELQKGNFDRALLLGTTQLLEILESPVVSSGQMQKLLEADGITDLEKVGHSRVARPNFFGKNRLGGLNSEPLLERWGLWNLAGLGALGLMIATMGTVFYFLFAREAYFTSEGWYRVWPFKLPKGSAGAEKTPEPTASKVSPIVLAIYEGEELSGFKIQVYLTKRPFEPNPIARAQKLFHRHYLSADAILIYVNLYRRIGATHGGPKITKSLEKWANLSGCQNEKAVSELIRALASTLNAGRNTTIQTV